MTYDLEVTMSDQAVVRIPVDASSYEEAIDLIDEVVADRYDTSGGLFVVEAI